MYIVDGDAHYEYDSMLAYIRFFFFFIMKPTFIIPFSLRLNIYLYVIQSHDNPPQRDNRLISRLFLPLSLTCTMGANRVALAIGGEWRLRYIYSYIRLRDILCTWRIKITKSPIKINSSDPLIIVPATTHYDLRTDEYWLDHNAYEYLSAVNIVVSLFFLLLFLFFSSKTEIECLKRFRCRLHKSPTELLDFFF